MKKFLFLILIFSLSKVGVSLAAPITGNTIQNFFLGTAFEKPSSYNQVLALLIGPQGKPGSVGVAGRDGFNGINGLDGKNGIDGAPGPVGPQGLLGPQGPIGPQGARGEKGETGPQGPIGASGPSGPAGVAGQSVVLTSLSNGDSFCANGGTKFQAGNTVTYACNGSSGGGSSSSTSFGGNNLELLRCDDLVTFNLGANFDHKFFLDFVRISDVNRKCIDLTLTMVFQITDPKQSDSNKYAANNKIYCSYPLTGGDKSIDTNIFTIPSSTACIVKPGDTSITLSDIATSDIDSIVGFQIT